MAQGVWRKEPAALRVIVAGFYTTQRQFEPGFGSFPLPFNSLQLFSGVLLQPRRKNFPGAVFGLARERRRGVPADQHKQAPQEQEDGFGRFQCSGYFAAKREERQR